MINSKKDYQYYLKADKISLGVQRKIPSFFGNEIWKFQRLMRKIEYYKNCKKSLIWKPFLLLLRWKYHNLGIKLSFEIPLNVFGPGLSIAHRGIIVNHEAKVGKNCRIHGGVNIGTAAGRVVKAPRIGDNVYIGPGAKLFGEIEIANGIAIGANSVVNKSFTEPNITIAGVPAVKISSKGSTNLIINGAD